MMNFRKRRSRLHPQLLAGSRRQRSGYSIKIIRGILLCGFFILILIFFRSPANSFAWNVLSPVYAAIGNIRTDLNVLFTPFASKLALQNENTLLRAELSDAKASAADRNLLAMEITEFRSALGRPEPAVKKILAYITARPPQTPYDTLQVDIGTEKGVSTGAIVGSGAVALGIIDTVTQSTSRVILFSSPQIKTDALLNGKLNIVVIGEGAGSLSAQVAQGTLVSVGDIVSLPDINDGVIATVQAIEAHSGQSYETLRLAMPISINDTTNVQVWLGTAKTILTIATTSQN